jgi:hypothetical protein
MVGLTPRDDKSHYVYPSPTESGARLDDDLEYAYKTFANLTIILRWGEDW